MQTKILTKSGNEIETIPRLNKGFFLNHRYTIGEFLGEGGIAYNYLAEDLESGRKLVVKQTKRVQRITNKISEDRFQMEREYRILSQLESPNLPQTMDMFEIDNILYMVREFRDGVMLTELMESGISLEALANICWQVLDILEYLHEKEIVYRDLKPSNILVDNGGNLFLLDFGTARYHHRGKKHDTIYLGTPGFAPPEQYGTAQTTQASDIYSFGALLYYLITGENPEDKPFEFAAFENINKKIRHKSMAEFLCKCLEMNPAGRFQNTKDVRFLLFEGNIFKTPSLRQEKIFEICFRKLTWKRMNFLEVACTVWLSVWLVCATFTVAFNTTVQEWIFGDHITLSEVIHPESYFLRKGIETLYSFNKEKSTEYSRQKRVMKYFDLALKINIDCLNTLFRKSSLLYDVGNLSEALSKEEYFTKYSRQKKAMRYFDLALKIKPNCLKALFHRAWIFSEMGYYDEASEDLAKLKKLDPAGWEYYQVIKKDMDYKRVMREYEIKKAKMMRIFGDGKLHTRIYVPNEGLNRNRNFVKTCWDLPESHIDDEEQIERCVYE